MLNEVTPGWTGPVVYAVQAESGGAVKLGMTSNVASAHRRLRHLQNGNPQKLRIVRLFEAPNGRADETALHRHFSSFRLEGEWFYNAPEVVAFTGCAACPLAPDSDAFWARVESLIPARPRPVIPNFMERAKAERRARSSRMA